MRTFFLVAILSVLFSGPASAQLDVGTAVGPDFFGYDRPSKNRRPESGPMALAVGLSFSTATWAAVGVSVSSVTAELSRIQAKGVYRQELIVMTLIAERSGRTLHELVEARAKGKSLRTLAEEAAVPFEDVYEKSLEVSRRSELLEGEYRSVRALPPPKAAKKESK